MLIPTVIFTKKELPSHLNQVLFCIEKNKLIEFDLNQYSPSQFAQKNHFIRHDKLDWHVNKSKPIFYTFELLDSQKDLENDIDLLDKETKVQWLTFPLAIKQIKNGLHRNFIQLVVQYISYGEIDENVVAAEYDKEWLKSLK